MPSFQRIKTPTHEFWEKMTPRGFEYFCHDILTMENVGVDIRQMRSYSDGGVDLFILEEMKNLTFFGSRQSGKSAVFIEIKRRESNNIHDFSRSLVAALLHNNCDQFVLITSAEFNINSFFVLSAICRKHRITFAYIHRELITRALIERRDVATDRRIPESIPNWNDIVGQKLPNITCRWSYQRVSSRNDCLEIDPVFAASERRDIYLDPTERIMVLLVIENFSDYYCNVTVDILSHDHWRIIQASARTLRLGARSAIGEQFIFELTVPQPVQLPRIQVETYYPQEAGAPTRIPIHAGELYARPFFEPNFVGKDALQYRKLLRDFIAPQADNPLPNERQGEWLLIEGAAGVGKSRIIKEALLTPNESVGPQRAINVHRYIVQRRSERKIILSVLGDLNDLFRNGNNVAIKAIELIKREGLTDAAIEAASLVFSKHAGKPLLIVLEDVHNGTEIFYRWLDAVFQITANAQAPSGSALRFCVAGRDDNSIPNPRQAKFAETVKQHLLERALTAQRIINVLPLDDDDAMTLVNSIFNGVTDSVRSRIIKLSAGIPFNILQIIEYLCEETIVEINNRRTYSIRNDTQFYNKDGIPDSMATLLKLRLRHLKTQPAGRYLVLILRCLSLLGLESTWSTYERLVKALAPGGDQWLLFNANYLTLDDGTRVRFSHEHILNYLQSTQAARSDWRKAATILAKQADLIADIEDWRRCRVFQIAGEEEKVVQIVTSVVGNGSVAGLARTAALGEIYQILRIGVSLWQSRVNDREGAMFLLNLYFLCAYASKFTRHYSATALDAKQALDSVRTHPNLKGLVGERTFNLACAKIEQIIGHAYQNIGDIDRSMTHVLGALTEARRWKVEEETHLDLLFDAEDRLRKNCIIFGRVAEALRAFQSACLLANQKGDNVLLGTGWFGEAELYFVQDPDRAEDVWRNLEHKAETHTDIRTRITLQLALIQVQLLKSSSQSSVPECLVRLKNLEKQSLELGLVGPLPKVKLLSGYAYYKLKQYHSAIEQFLSCYEKAEQFGYGVFMWFSQNNIALVHQHLGQRDSQAAARSAFSTALDKADTLGFFRHLGTKKPLFFQAALVDNALRFFEREKLTSHQRSLVGRLARNGYDVKGLPRKGLTHPSFETEFGAMMLYV